MHLLSNIIIENCISLLNTRPNLEERNIQKIQNWHELPIIDQPVFYRVFS